MIVLLFFTIRTHFDYRNDPKYSDRQVWANSVDADQKEQSDRGLHCMPFCLHLLDTFLYGKITFSKF